MCQQRTTFHYIIVQIPNNCPKTDDQSHLLMQFGEHSTVGLAVITAGERRA